MTLSFSWISAVACVLMTAAMFAQELPYQTMADRAIDTMKPAAGERVLIRLDPQTMPAFEPALRGAFERAGARVETIQGRDIERFEERLANTDIYVWMPGGSAITSPDQGAALRRWADQGGTRRELHFHWSDGTLTLEATEEHGKTRKKEEQTPAPHTPAVDRLYADALEIDYAALDRAQDAAIAVLRSGEVRVTTPAGTDVRFRTGDRPFNKQNGDGSRERAQKARIRIDRHIELPAGIIRVAPVETSVQGVVAVPTLRVGQGSDAVARNVRLEFAEGKVVKVHPHERAAEIEKLLQSTPALASFRELGVGMNPRLAVQPGSSLVPYYGYGAGLVRLSLGDNEELGGLVRGPAVVWNFFADATITVGDRTLVKDGRLTLTTK